MGSGASIDIMIVYGHNNKVYANSSSTMTHKVQNMIIVGHNNRFDNLYVMGDLIISGHNNNFGGLKLAKPVQDNGINNKLGDCYNILP